MSSITAESVLTIAQLMRERHETCGPDDVLITNTDRLTYAELDERSRSLAAELVLTGAGKGTRVGVLAPNGPEWMLTWFAAARIGAIVVPVNTYQTPTELHRMLQDADVQVLVMVSSLGNHDYVARLEDAVPGLGSSRGRQLLLPSLPSLRAIWCWDGATRPWMSGVPDGAGDERALAVVDAIEAAVHPADVLTVIYTSGSTGQPKGVVHTHGAVVRHSRRLRIQLRNIREGDRVFSPMPFFWVGGLSIHILGTMHMGGAILCMPLFDAGPALDLMERERATVLLGWPHARRALFDHPTFAPRDLTSVRRPGWNPDETLAPQSLGMTETCGPHTGSGEDEALPDELAGSFGRPVPGVEHRIVDLESGAALDDGQIGEICIRGEDVSIGRLGEERSQTFDVDGWYHTGDLGSFRDGHLFFTGRLSDLIKSSGMNVAAVEVEAALVALSGVDAAFVVGVPHPDRGEEIGAIVVLRADADDLDAETVRARLRDQLSSYKVPQRIRFAPRGDLPMLDSGKVDKRELVKLFD